jgi:hypothetical protein
VSKTEFVPDEPAIYSPVEPAPPAPTVTVLFPVDKVKALSAEALAPEVSPVTELR